MTPQRVVCNSGKDIGMEKAIAFASLPNLTPSTCRGKANVRPFSIRIKPQGFSTFLPQYIRLGWHDAGTYVKNIQEWPKCSDANGSMRFEIELKHNANVSLSNALKLLQSVKDKNPNITYANLFQLTSAMVIDVARGPNMPMKYGCVDASGPKDCPLEGKLPNAYPSSPTGHLHDIFYKMGFTDKEIVALLGAQTLGRSRPECSGWGKHNIKYTKDGPGARGGQSWTVEWIKIDNSYFKELK